MLQVKQIINEVFLSNTYVVFDNAYNYCWLIDIGDFDRVTETSPSNVGIRGVLLTHTHFDHMYGINALHNAYPDCRVFTAK